MRYASKHERGYVRSTWYNARSVTRLLNWQSWNGETRTVPAKTPAETLADILKQPYIREHSTANRCHNCGALHAPTLPDAAIRCPDCDGRRYILTDCGGSYPCPRCRRES